MTSHTQHKTLLDDDRESNPMQQTTASRKIRRELTEGWRLHLLEPSPNAPVTSADLPATVPGCVHIDLQDAGLIADPVVDRNEDTQHWVGESVWQYRLSFHYSPERDEHTDLVFDGLDTYAAISLNGEELGRTANMHRSYRFPVGDRLRDGNNDLVVTFAAPTLEAARLRDEIGDLPNPYGQPYNFVRKMASNFGWDWGPRLTTSGIWKPVWLQSWTNARLAAVRPSIDVRDDGVGVVDLVVDLERSAGVAVTLRAEIAGHHAETITVDNDRVALRLLVPDVERWHPIGRGEQPLYDLVVTAVADDDVVDQTTRRIGFRTVELDTTRDDDGSRWALIVNGERVWVRGFNWIPDDTFPSRVDRRGYARRIDEAMAANANLIRVWGGGIYESDDFYEICDERGILVWQDFANACAAYPEDELADEMRHEATDAVNRLMSHPSLVLWCGNNECQLGWWNWGWPELVGDRGWGLAWYDDLLPGILNELDLNRPYISGSPTSGETDRAANDPAHGPVHIWDVWNERDYVHYRDYRPRFVAEFGFQAPASYPTLSDAITGGELRLDDPAFVHHQKAQDGFHKLHRCLVEHFGSADTFADWHFLTQLNQARALELGVGHLRAMHDHCSGAVWWQLNDCWPAISWSVLDAGGRRKLAWYAARRVFAPRALVIEPSDDAENTVAATLINDSREPWSGSLLAHRVTTAGTPLAKESLLFEIDPDSAMTIPLPAELARPEDRAAELLVLSAADVRACWSWVRDRELTGQPARWRSHVDERDGTVVVSAETVVRDLCLLAEHVDPDAVVDSQLVTLLPGEQHTFRVHSPDARRLASAFTPSILRAANEKRQRR